MSGSLVACFLPAPVLFCDKPVGPSGDHTPLPLGSNGVLAHHVTAREPASATRSMTGTAEQRPAGRRPDRGGGEQGAAVRRPDYGGTE
ncbi:hypothetical protein BRADI_1g13185v3 [Brachypodium distachyon]|uniref:Uncharacterized protein n=1 Tax=Brachypodium distachyon TaxID=15368 RepID=A0A2K2DJ99_BRADI|nr:hypothetical protein BRADI_1g13185v3 [Brachypodium distachyon]